ncbi:unnamed protein product [Prunus brigantina]
MKSSRISLRPFKLSDANDFLKWASDNKVTRYLRWNTITSREEALTYIEKLATHPWRQSICLDDQSIGYVSVKPEQGDDTCRAHVSYVVSAEYWGQGIATVALRMAMCRVFRELPCLVRIEALVEVENKGSQRVLEKVGFLKEGLLRKYGYCKGEIRDIMRRNFLSVCMAMRNRMENISNAKSKQTIIRKRWVIVPDDIMQSVLQRLSIFDYFRCRSVCRSWRDSVDRAISSKRCRPAPQLPWLFCSRDRDFLSYCEYEPKSYKLNLPSDDAHDEYVGSIEGWLMRVDGTGSIITLLNPISGSRVMLPPCEHELTAASFISKLVASSVPSPPSLPCTCIVACLSRSIEKTWLGVCRPTDKSWTRIDEEVLNFESIEFIDGKLYAATKNLSQFLLVFQFDTNDDQQLHYTARRLIVLDDTPRLPDRKRFDYIFRIKKSRLSLAKDFSTSKELIMITFPDDHTLNLLASPPNYAEAFQVFKLEFSNNKNKNDTPPPRWVEIVGIRDRILFLCQKCHEFKYVLHSDTNDLQDIHLRHCIDSGLSLFTRPVAWLTPNPW